MYPKTDVWAGPGERGATGLSQAAAWRPEALPKADRHTGRELISKQKIQS